MEREISASSAAEKQLTGLRKQYKEEIAGLMNHIVGKLRDDFGLITYLKTLVPVQQKLLVSNLYYTLLKNATIKNKEIKGKMLYDKIRAEIIYDTVVQLAKYDDGMDTLKTAFKKQG